MHIQGNEKSNDNLRIAIVGGGIGGLALATFLASSQYQNANLNIALYEASPSLTELGAGVGVWLRTWRTLSSYSFKSEDGSIETEGLLKELRKVAPEGRDMSESIQRAFEFRKGDQTGEGVSFYAMDIPFGVLTLHRAEFQQALAKYAIPHTNMHFNKRLASYSYTDENDVEGAEIILHFEDGTETHADILIGADGIRSPTRKTLLARMSETSKETNPGYESLNDPVWSGTLVYRNLIPATTLEASHPGHRALLGPIVYFGHSKHLIAFPITTASGKMVNMVAFVSEPSKEGTKTEGPWMRLAEQSELWAHYKGWEPEVMSIVQLAEKPSVWAIHTVKPLPSFTDPEGRVALLGDAAHAMTPHQGAGGGQAIEDAHVLASLLSHPNLSKDNIAEALKAYNAIRIPIARQVMRNSRMTGMLYELTEPFEGPSGMNIMALQKDGDGIRGLGHGHNDHNRLDSGFSELFGTDSTEALKAIANRIISIHDWEWTNVDGGVNQAAQAFQLFGNTIN